MKFSKMIWLACGMAALVVFSGCQSTTPAEMVCGREWNSGSGTVADTTSTFALNDPMLIQYNYGKGFDFAELTITFYTGTDEQTKKKLWSHSASVNPKVSNYTLRGKSARELTHQKTPGPIVVEISNGDRVLISKELNLVGKR